LYFRRGRSNGFNGAGPDTRSPSNGRVFGALVQPSHRSECQKTPCTMGAGPCNLLLHGREPQGLRAALTDDSLGFYKEGSDDAVR